MFKLTSVKPFALSTSGRMAKMDIFAKYFPRTSFHSVKYCKYKLSGFLHGHISSILTRIFRFKDIKNFGDF